MFEMTLKTKRTLRSFRKTRYLWTWGAAICWLHSSRKIIATRSFRPIHLLRQTIAALACINLIISKNRRKIGHWAAKIQKSKKLSQQKIFQNRVMKMCEVWEIQRWAMASNLPRTFTQSQMQLVWRRTSHSKLKDIIRKTRVKSVELIIW